MSIAPSKPDERSWRDIESVLPRIWRQLAVKHSFCRSLDDPKLDGKVRMIFFLVAASLSLRTSAAMFAAAGLRAVSHVALHQWFRAAPAFLSAVLVALTDAQHRFDGLRWAGYRVRAIDATTVQRPGASGTTARVHYAFQLNDMTMSECKVTDDKTGESFVNFRTGKDILDIADRGYSNATSIAAAVDQEGDVLVRWNPYSLPLYGRGEVTPIKVRRIAAGLIAGQADEWDAEVRPKSRPGPIGIRLIIAKLPEDKARQARERARTEHDGKPSAEVLFLAGYVMLVTTVPKTRLDTAQLVELYRLRWQVELQFKRDKSIGGLDQLPNFVAATIASWVLAKIILAELCRRLVSLTVSNEQGTDVHQAEITHGDLPSFALAPWETAVLGWTMLRQALLAIPTESQARRAFVRRFLDHLSKLKARGSKRRQQIENFLARLVISAASQT